MPDEFIYRMTWCVWVCTCVCDQAGPLHIEQHSRHILRTSLHEIEFCYGIDQSCQGRDLFWSSSCRREFASSRNVATCALKMAFSFSKKLARMAISSSRALRASRDFFAAWLFLFLRSKYLPSFKSSGMGFFSLRGRRCDCCVKAIACATALDGPGRWKRNFMSILHRMDHY